jgi:hypothetical protein
MRIYQIGGGMLAPGTYTFPFQYQLPEGIPGSFHERNPMPNIPSGCEWVENDTYGESFMDSDDEEDGSAPQVRGRSGLLAVVHYKLKVTLDVNGQAHRSRSLSMGWAGRVGGAMQIDCH